MASVVGEASSSSPPSTSIPPRPRLCTHHVFLSFSGKDTRNGITGHLHAALERKGIKTYIDDRDLEMGEVIKDELLKAIEESMFAITVFSPNYASSSWCLDELKHIVKCSKNLGLSIVSVFYGVEPSDVRYQKGSFGKAFKTRENRFGRKSKKVRRWRAALAEVANLSGKDFKDKHEATLVESIADHIHNKLIPKLPSSTENLVGIASRVKEVMRYIGIGLNDVRFIGIWGMGGIGKTTTATAVYEAIQEKFEVSCFLANVREASVSNKIVDKQKQLLAKANISVNAPNDEHDIQKKIQNSLRNKKVLLVLDDVSDSIELKNLAGEKDWFGPGSRIIITTRDIQLLKSYEVHGIYEVQGLVDNESFDLFCLKAFKQKKPDKKYLDLAKEVVKYSGGLPLALEVLGPHLYGRSVDVWGDAIGKMKSTPLAKIDDTLKISYDSLDVTEKDIFLDISCFFKGWKKDDVIKLLESCGYKGVRIGIDILIDRSLVKINEKYNYLYKKYDAFEMHDLLQDMGRSIVIQESPIGQRSRLWTKKDIDLVLANNQGSRAIQGIVLPKPEVLKLPRRIAEFFSSMTQLKLLILSNTVANEHDYGVPTWLKAIGLSFDDRLKTLRLSDQQYELSSLPTWLKVLHWLGYPFKTLPLSNQQYELSSLPTSLKVLHWSGYPFKTLPLSNQQYELVEIRLQHSYIENLWHGKKYLGKLKHLDLSGSDKLEQTPDLFELPILQTLLLAYCESLTEVHPSVVLHKSLTLLDLTKCTRLEALPGKLEMSSLNELILDGCSNFKSLPEFGECMKSLSRLSLKETSIKKLPTSFGCLVGLEDLDFSGCRELVCLADLLSTLNLSYCNLTEETFPPYFGPFPSLPDLDLYYNDFVGIPINFHDIPKLKCLQLDYCKELQCLPELPSSIRKLMAWECWSLDISEFNILSTVCGAFVSPSQDPSQVLLEMVIPRLEIPSWFVHRQDGNSVSIPCDYPRNEWLGIALCFLSIDARRSSWADFDTTRIESALVAHNSTVFNTIRIAPKTYGGNHLYIICLTNDYFSDGFHQGTCFELSGFPAHVQSMTSAARCVSKEDIEDLEKSVIERPQKKRKKKKRGRFDLSLRFEDLSIREETEQ